MGFLSGLFKKYTYHSEGKNTTFKQTPRQWALATNAVLCAYNGLPVDLLGGSEKKTGTTSGTRIVLKKDWDVVSRDSLIKMLSWLRDHGHRGVETSDSDGKRIPGFMAIYNGQKASLKEYLVLDCLQYYMLEEAEKRNIEKNDFLGWDYIRYINLAGMGYVADYIEEKELDTFLLPVAKKLQETFDSWEELGTNYILGRGYWAYDESATDGMQDEIKGLLTSPDSPWMQIPFKGFSGKV